MLDALILGVIGVFAFYFLRYNRFHFYKLATSSVGLLDDILKDESEDKKLPRIEKGTKLLVIALFKVLTIIILTGTSTFCLIYAFSYLNNELIWNSPFGLIGFSIGGSIPFFIPTNTKSSYSEISQLFHHLVLDNSNIGLKLLSREIKKYTSKVKKEKFLIVSGLARSGTTNLMNSLHGSGSFTSLSYSNMPFLLSPRAWRKLYRPRSIKKAERSHGDGISIDMRSNEALDEYFFKSIYQDSFIGSENLIKHSLSDKGYQLYIDYQGLICREPEKFYLSKNNNMLLRYDSLRQLNKEFVFLVLFRDPLSHAYSLMQMHKKFCTQQGNDPFIEDYMDWLGHHEFGLNQKPFKFHDQIPEGNKNELDYWLLSWINYYDYASLIADDNTYFICYETYCLNPNIILDKVLVEFKSFRKDDFKPYLNQKEIKEDYSEEILHEAQLIYNKLKNKELK
jgi:hypothetical protein